MKTALVLLTLFSAGSWAQTVQITSQNLRQLLESKNSHVQAARLETTAAATREGHLGRSFMPSVEVYAAQESFKLGRAQQKTQPAYGAEAKVNLFHGGRDRIEEKVRRLDTSKKEYQLKRIVAEELEKARAAYWECLYLSEKTALLNSSLEINKKNLAAAQRRIRSGVATDSDRFEFEMKDVELRRELSKIQVEQAAQSRKLALLLGVKAGVNVLLNEKLGHDHDYENLLAHSEADHDFQFKEKELQSEQQSLLAKSQSRAWLPKVDAFAAYNQYNEREEEFPSAKDRTETVIGLRATISLSAGLESSREAQALAHESAASRFAALHQHQEIELHLQAEMDELKLLHDQVHEAEENISRADRYYKLTQSEYSRGVKNSPDVLGASEKLFDMKHKKLEILRDFQLAKAHVLSKIGK